MADRNGYIGRAPGDSSITVARQTFSPTATTTDFTFASGYTVGYLDLFLNGTKLIEGVDYNATDTSTISLVSAAISGDVLEGVAYKAFNLGDARRIGIQSGGALIGNIDTLNFVGTGNTFALNGGTIDVSISAGAGGTWSNYDSNAGVTTTKKVKISNNLEVTGVTTSTGGFVGNLTGNASGSSGSCSGNSATATVATNAQGLTGTPDITVRNIVGVAATLTGVLTYEDVTNIDSIGIVTARTGIEFGSAGVGGTISALGHGEFVGIVTASALDAAISFWTLGADGSNHYTFTGPGDLSGDTDPDLQLIRGQKYIFKNRSGGHPFRIQSTPNGSAGTAYNDGVTNNDAGNGTDLIFDVPFDAPSILYYQCTAHGSMGGPIYVGSSSGDDVNVGAAVTIYASTGIVSATSYYGSGSNLTGIDAAPSITATASGAIGVGSAVAINSDGTVSIITGSSATEAYGSETQFESGNVSNASISYDSNADRVVIVYNDVSNNERGTAVVATASGTSLTFGTPVVFDDGGTPGTTDIDSAYDASTGKIVIAYTDDDDAANPGKAIVGTVDPSNNSISFGTAVTFESGNTGRSNVVYDSNAQKIVIVYRDADDGQKGKATVCTVSGTSISFGTVVTFASGTIKEITAVYHSGENKIFIVYKDEDNSNRGSAIAGTVSGTSISFGSVKPNVFNFTVNSTMSAIYSIEDERIVVSARDGNAIKVKPFALSGTTITEGSESNAHTNCDSNHLVYDENAQNAKVKEKAEKKARKGATVAVTRPKSKVRTKK